VFYIVSIVLKRNIIYLKQQESCLIWCIFVKKKNLVLVLKTALTFNL